MDQNTQQNAITGLLAVIAVLLLVQTAALFMGGGDDKVARYSNPATTNQSANANPSMTPDFNASPNANASQVSATNTTFTFSEMEKDFGSVKTGSKNKHTFQVTNTGTNPLNLSSINADPGATVVSYTTTPIEPGSSGEIAVEFEPSETGQVSKVIHINANTEPAHLHLTVKGNVE